VKLKVENIYKRTDNISHKVMAKKKKAAKKVKKHGRRRR